MLLAFAGAGLLLALVAVLIDRLNFPQPRFRPRKIAIEGRGPHRDRTGAHIVDHPAGDGPDAEHRAGRPVPDAPEAPQGEPPPR
jgi:hypothetical protein